MGVLGNANLFFLNPNGIFFGENASLDVNGSFIASTADSLVFGDEFAFSASNPTQVPPLLTINLIPGLQYGTNNSQSTIINSGNLTVASRQTSNETNLAVNPGQTLALIGGDVTIDRAEIISPGSNIILGGLNQAGIIKINPDLSLSFPQGIKRGDVSLINSTILDIAGNDGGSININAWNIKINDSGIFAGIGSRLGFENAQAGDITLDATDSLIVDNSFILNNVNFNAIGNSGNLNIFASNILITNNGAINVSAMGKGQAGSLKIEAQQVTLDRGSFTVETRRGDQGNITIDKADTLILRNNSQITTNASELATGGDITITSNLIVLQDNSDIIANAIVSRVQITTQALSQEPGSEITAGSERYTDGRITINSLDELPDVPVVDVEGLLARNLCETGSGKTANSSSFIITGRGGLPPNPYEPLDSNDMFVDVQLPTQWQEKSGANSSTSRSATEPIVEATGWIVNEEGDIKLVTQIPSTPKCGSKNVDND